MRGLVFWLLVLVIAGAVFVYSGMYDIGADKPHWTFTTQMLDTLRNQSIKYHSTGVDVPSDLADTARIQAGAHHYAEMCASCHLTPGMRSTELREGLYPQPPDLAKQALGDPAEAFWVIKHGVKLTAMPAWGKSHDDKIIWDMVAFIRQLPSMSEDQFVAMAGTHGDDGHHDHDEHHDHGEHDHGEHDHGDMPAPASSAQ